MSAYHPNKSELKLVFIFATAILVFSACAERGYDLQVQTKARSVNAQNVTDLREGSLKAPEGVWDKMIKAVKQKLRNDTSPAAATQPPARETSAVSTLPGTAPLDTQESEALLNIPEPLAEKPQNKTAPSPLQNKPTKVRKKPIPLPKKATLPPATDPRQEPSLAPKPTRSETPRQTASATDTEEKLSLLDEKQKRIEARKKALEEKLTRLNKEKSKSHSETKLTLGDDKGLKLIPIDRTFFKFGTSEIHGHVIYLDQSGSEKLLAQPRSYLVPAGATVAHWYENYYLKNRTPSKKKVASYLQRSELDLDRNFSFYGVPAGKYYIVIVAKDPQEGKTVYIAKKLDVKKYKKVMAVFSKKL